MAADDRQGVVEGAQNALLTLLFYCTTWRGSINFEFLGYNSQWIQREIRNPGVTGAKICPAGHCKAERRRNTRRPGELQHFGS